MSRRWLSERKHDYYHRMASRQGYRSRAAFKLKQIDRRFGILEGARHVLDLGAAPGGWLQVVSESVGDEGLVVGVDLDDIESFRADNIRTIVGDVTKRETLERIKKEYSGRWDIVLSDLSPNVSGIWEVDHPRQIHLARSALRTASDILDPKGWFVVKVFQGFEYEGFLSEVRKKFKFVKVFKPRASRKGSAEVYIIAREPLH